MDIEKVFLISMVAIVVLIALGSLINKAVEMLFLIVFISLAIILIYSIFQKN